MRVKFQESSLQQRIRRCFEAVTAVASEEFLGQAKAKIHERVGNFLYGYQ